VGCATLALVVALVGVARAAAGEPPALYVKGGALWLRDGSAAPRSLGPTPSELGAVTAMLVDAAGKVVLLGAERGWQWSRLRGADAGIPALAFRKLPCAAGRASLTADGTSVLCAGPTGQALVIQLETGKQLTHPAPLDRVALVGAGAELRVVWADERGVWTAPLGATKPARQLAPTPPLRGLSVSPTGERALGVFAGEAHHRREVVAQDILHSFALDGRAARRKVIQRGVALTWSADGKWVLVQDDNAACIMAASGGQYKCWRGYRGVALSADGRWALLLGNREAKKKSRDRSARRDARQAPKLKADEQTRRALPAGNDIDSIIEGIEAAGDGPEGEEDQDAEEDRDSERDHGREQDDDEPGGGGLNLYRAKLEGAFTDRPVELETHVDEAAAFLPALPALPQAPRPAALATGRTSLFAGGLGSPSSGLARSRGRPYRECQRS
jgi:hypothetical protein